jgi:type 1 glutamine amidotransferase
MNKAILSARIVTVAAVVLLNAAIASAQAGHDKDPLKILVITGGHKYEQGAFEEMFRSMKTVSFTHVTLAGEAEKTLQPAEALLKPEAAAKFDVLVFYDVTRRCDPYLNDLLRTLEQGKGVVFLHHAIASCVDNPEYAFVVGGTARFGRPSGPIPPANYKAGVTFRAHIEDGNSPITQGMSDFEITDELYSNYLVNTDVHLLLSTDHPDSARALGWTWQYKKSPIVFLELGHDHTAFENPNYRTLVERSIHWVAASLKK